MRIQPWIVLFHLGSAGMLCACTAGDTMVALMRTQDGEQVFMRSTGKGTQLAVSGRDGRSMTLPWMSNAHLVMTRDGKAGVTALAVLRFTQGGCDRSAVVLFSDVEAAAETIGECGAVLRMGEVDGTALIMDDRTASSYKISGAKLERLVGPPKVKAAPEVKK